ncbi:MAG: hypothetical protein KC421_01750 [Anaerolineales bacterium]|nr:hypothetical protein [Anaerolineales bacterium]
MTIFRTPYHIYWLGGSPCSGKSSIAQILAERYDLLVYSCDGRFNHHRSLATPTDQPALHHLGQMSWNDIWMRPVAAQVHSVIEVYREEFPMILADLRTLPSDRPILVEGAALLPELVAQQLQGGQTTTSATPSAGVYLIPTPAFQHKLYAQRDWIHGILAQCADPQQAFANWMARDVGFGQWVAETAVSRDFPVIHVDGNQTIAQNAVQVAAHFQLRS